VLGFGVGIFSYEFHEFTRIFWFGLMCGLELLVLGLCFRGLCFLVGWGRFL